MNSLGVNRTQSKVWGVGRGQDIYKHRDLIIKTDYVKQREIMLGHLESARQAGRINMDMDARTFLLAVNDWFATFGYELPQNASLTYKALSLHGINPKVSGDTWVAVNTVNVYTLIDSLIERSIITKEQSEMVDVAYILDWMEEEEGGYSDEIIIEKILNTIEETS